MTFDHGERFPQYIKKVVKRFKDKWNRALMRRLLLADSARHPGNKVHKNGQQKAYF